MASSDASGSSIYAFISGKRVARQALVEFSQAIWPDVPPDRLLSSWWMRADDECSVAIVHKADGLVAALCSARPTQWIIGGQTFAATAIGDWYVAPAYEGRMLGRRLLRYFEAPDHMLYALSISAVAIPYLVRIGWKGPYTSTLSMLPLPAVARLGHAALAGRHGCELRDYTVASGALPSGLADDLERIEARRAANSAAHMRRGAAEWSWHLSVCGERSYRFCLAYRDAEPAGYGVVRRLTPGSSRLLGKVSGALLVDLVAVDDDPKVLRALVARAAAGAAEMGAAVVLAVTTQPAQRRALSRMGFLSPGTPLLGPSLARRAPVYMWLPRGPAAQLAPDAVALTFMDSDVDFRL